MASSPLGTVGVTQMEQRASHQAETASVEARAADMQGGSARNGTSKLRRLWRFFKGKKFTREMMLRARIDSIREGAELDPHRDRRAVAIRHADIARRALD